MKSNKTKRMNKEYQQQIVAETTALLKREADALDIPARWIAGALTDDDTGRPKQAVRQAVNARHRIIAELVEGGHPKDAVARCFGLNQQSIHQILRKLKKS